MTPSPPPLPEHLEAPPVIVQPWGFWASVGLSAAIALAFVMAQGVIVAAYLIVGHVMGWEMPSEESLESNGFILGAATCFSAPVAVGLCWAFAGLRRGLPVREYLALQWPDGKTATRWAIGLLALVLASDALTHILDKPIVPEFMMNAYQTAGFAPLLWLAVIVAAPIGEEFLFRGFLFQGLQGAKCGPYGAILITALTWAIIHLQYDVHGILTIFIAGIFLGFARWKTNSMLLTIVLHAIMNLIATIEVIVLLNWFKP